MEQNQTYGHIRMSTRVMRVKKTRQDQRSVYRYPVDVPDGKGGYR